MHIHFCQVYLEPGVEFPFSTRFQEFMSKALTPLLKPSERFAKTYGTNFDLIFYISAKTGIPENEIKGPTVFRKTKDVEYTVFLPFDMIKRHRDVPSAALGFIFRGIYQVLERLDIDTTRIRAKQDSITEQICSNPLMFGD